jgi:hypothetical protein
MPFKQPLYEFIISAVGNSIQHLKFVLGITTYGSKNYFWFAVTSDEIKLWISLAERKLEMIRNAPPLLDHLALISCQPVIRTRMGRTGQDFNLCSDSLRRGHTKQTGNHNFRELSA